MVNIPKFNSFKTPDELSKYLKENPETPLYYLDGSGEKVKLGNLSAGYYCDSEEEYVFFKELQEERNAESPYWPLKVFFDLLADKTTDIQYLFRCAKNCCHVECLDAHTPLEAFECSLAYTTCQPVRGRSRKLRHIPDGYLCVQVCSMDDVNIYLILQTRPPVHYDELAGI